MKAGIIFIVLFSILSNESEAQLDQGIWVTGGSGSFSSENHESIKNRSFYLNPSVGYFVINKMPIGLNFIITSSSSKTVLYTARSSTYLIGPYVRYYFLHKDSRINLFTEGNYQLGFQKVSNSTSSPISETSNSSIYSFFIGPEVFFNSSVGLELQLGMQHLSVNQSSNTQFQINVGFRIHLEREQ